MPFYEQRALDFCLYASSNNVIVHPSSIFPTLAYNLRSAFFGLVQFIPLACQFPSTIPEKHFFFHYLALCITPLGRFATTRARAT